MLKVLIPILMVAASCAASAQTVTRVPFEIYGGYDYLSNSFNGVPSSRQPLNGWNVSVAFPEGHHLRFKMDVMQFSGTNLNAQQKALFIMSGAQYERQFHRERFFAEALFGVEGLNRYWGANGSPGGTASFATMLGGGVDTPLSKHFAIRAQGDYVHTNNALVQSVVYPLPYRIPGLPQNFGRFTVGIVWLPKVEQVRPETPEEMAAEHEPVEQELAFEGGGSVGHFHIYTGAWWSTLQVGGVEYDRHSWGRFMKARIDYVAEFLPVMILHQPTYTDPWGDTASKARSTVPGIGISPLGIRALWRDNKTIKPFFTIKLGMTGFTQKAFSQYSSYEDFSLQIDTGVNIRLADRWDFRVGGGYFHISNAFLVPSNPGQDMMMCQGALVYHLKNHIKK